jgi:hypothetical protein
MNLRPKTVHSGLLWFAGTAYLIVSAIALFATTGGYTFILLLFSLGPVYLLVWLLLTIAAVMATAAQKLRYSPLIFYGVLGVFPWTVLFNIADGGYYGIGCQTKNFIQQFLDRSTGCAQLWVKPETHLWIVAIYALLLIIFAVDVLLRQLNQPPSS